MDTPLLCCTSSVRGAALTSTCTGSTPQAHAARTCHAKEDGVGVSRHFYGVEAAFCVVVAAHDASADGRDDTPVQRAGVPRVRKDEDVPRDSALIGGSMCQQQPACRPARCSHWSVTGSPNCVSAWPQPRQSQVGDAGARAGAAPGSEPGASAARSPRRRRYRLARRPRAASLQLRHRLRLCRSRQRRLRQSRRGTFARVVAEAPPPESPLLLPRPLPRRPRRAPRFQRRRRVRAGLRARRCRRGAAGARACWRAATSQRRGRACGERVPRALLHGFARRREPGRRLLCALSLRPSQPWLGRPKDHQRRFEA